MSKEDLELFKALQDIPTNIYDDLTPEQIKEAFDPVEAGCKTDADLAEEAKWWEARMHKGFNI